MDKTKRDADTDTDADSVRGGACADDRSKGVEVITTVATALSAVGGMKVLLEMAKLWVEDRKQRRIKLRKGDIELELEGSMSQSEIQRKIKLFQELAKDDKGNDIKIIVPPS